MPVARRLRPIDLQRTLDAKLLCSMVNHKGGLHFGSLGAMPVTVGLHCIDPGHFVGIGNYPGCQNVPNATLATMAVLFCCRPGCHKVRP